MTRKGNRFRRVGIAVGSVVLLAFGVGGCGLTNSMIFQPPSPSYGANEVNFVRSKNYRIAVKYLPNPTAKYVLLYSHGNAEDLGHTMPLMQAFHAAGFGVVTYDYPGYGQSLDYRRGPTESGAYRAAHLAYRHVTQRLEIPPDRLIIVGRSIGSGPATYLAENHESAGLVLISPMVSAFRVMTKYPILPFDKFKNLSRISEMNASLLVIHGTADRVIPVWHGQKIHQRAKGRKRGIWLEGIGHNDLFERAGNVVLHEMQQFADGLHTNNTLKKREE